MSAIRLALAMTTMAGAVAAQPLPEAAELAAIIARDVVAIEPYRPFGIGTQRGPVMHLKARQTAYGDCRTQQLTFFRRDRPTSPHVTGTPELESLALKSRYRRPDWIATRAPRECGDPRRGAWITAADDYAFSRAADVLGRLVSDTKSKAPPGIAYACERPAYRACNGLPEELREALARTDGELRMLGGGFVVDYGGPGQDLSLEVELGDRGAVTAVRVEHRFPTLS